MIRRILFGLKNNLLLVASVLVCLVSLVVLYYIHSRGNSFSEQVAARAKDEKKIAALMHTQVKVPPEKADDPPRIIPGIVVNQASIKALIDIYDQMHREYTDIYKFAVGINSQGHLPMLDGLFPDPSRSTTKAFDARYYYVKAFDEFFKPYSPASDQPRLDARPAPTAADIKAVTDRAEADFQNTNLIGASTKITPEMEDQLKKLKAKRVIEYLISQAKKIHMYCQTDPGQSDYPFKIMSWANQTNQPDARDLWEAQMQLWVIQDITKAIAQTNRTDNAEVDVMSAPIKRLVMLDLLPDYVGINHGISGSGQGGPAPAAVAAPTPPGVPRNGPPSNKPPSPIVLAANAKLPDDFSLAPTGRRSNEIYDVRHVILTLVMDSQRMPEFFDNLAQVNFMTVLRIEISDVDEYSEAKLGYVYGPGDSVKVTMLIETLWLREWTLKYMPQVVREALGAGGEPAAQP